MKTSSDRQLIAPFLEIGFTESNCDVRILVESSQLAVCEHAQYIFGAKKQLRSTGGGLQVAMHSQLPRFLVFSERELMFMFAICRRPSVCRLSSVCRL